METVSRNISDLGISERAAFESLLGHQLRENQRIIIQIVDLDLHNDSVPKPSTITEWAIFADLTDEEASDLQEAILARSPSREFDI